MSELIDIKDLKPDPREPVFYYYWYDLHYTYNNGIILDWEQILQTLKNNSVKKVKYLTELEDLGTYSWGFEDEDKVLKVTNGETCENLIKRLKKYQFLYSGELACFARYLGFSFSNLSEVVAFVNDPFRLDVAIANRDARKL